ncbi:hypothetical protein QBC35DRAFT_515061 [Podospora australis]|uniref:Malate dehydrogenase n=1 Tax=Podospora australis TaxID=1536484 RepID=A0AAN6WTU2_9PEZI|nr:hypothetical protein QBC35DRAFT_515061 [Podospora australis]
MLSVKSLLLAALASVAYAAPACQPSATPTIPKTGGATELPVPAANLVLKKIALGHGIQNYTCANTSATGVSQGAVAVLYDVTSFYPGTAKSGIVQKIWDEAPGLVLKLKSLPLNIKTGSKYGADPAKPFPKPEDLKVAGFPVAKFLGHHYFDAAGTPMFDLNAVGLQASVTKLLGVDAPAKADKGPLNTGAVAWLQLGDSGKGLSKGLSQVYRVITAGGAAQSCAVAGAGVHSVPYTTYYWFY